jgi:hypothetical protein
MDIMSRFELKKKPQNNVLCCVLRQGLDPRHLPPVCQGPDTTGGIVDQFSPLPETFSFVYAYTLPELVRGYEGGEYPLLRERCVA